MLNEQTFEKLFAMKLFGMADQCCDNSTSACSEDKIEMFVERAVQHSF